MMEVVTAADSNQKTDTRSCVAIASESNCKSFPFTCHVIMEICHLYIKQYRTNTHRTDVQYLKKMKEINDRPAI